MTATRKVIAGRVFLSGKDAEAFAKKMPAGFNWEIIQSCGHSLVCVKDYGDINGTYKACTDAGIRAFVWLKN